jgi:fucose permease
VLWLVRAVGLLVLLGGLLWLAVVLATQGVERAGSWASVLGVGAAITGAVITLVTAWLQQRPAVSELAGVEQVVQAAAELRTVVWE